MNPVDYLTPFLNVIKSPETSARLTATALTAVERVLENCVLGMPHKFMFVVQLGSCTNFFLYLPQETQTKVLLKQYKSYQRQSLSASLSLVIQDMMNVFSVRY